MRGRRVESQVEEKMGRIVRCTRSVMKTWMKTKRMAMGLKDELDPTLDFVLALFFVGMIFECSNGP